MTTTDDRITRVSRRRLLKATPIAIGALGMTGTAVANCGGVTTQSADVFGQGLNGSVVAADGATIRRTTNGVSIQLAMPTPEPGTYRYPNPSPTATDEAGPPEAFTLWGFVWNDPSAADWDGAFLVAGHGVGGPHLTLSGTISTSTDPFAGEALDNPDGAEVHLAVAPHGAVDSDLLPGQLQTPSGPGPDIWWLAVFEPPA